MAIEDDLPPASIYDLNRMERLLKVMTWVDAHRQASCWQAFGYKLYCLAEETAKNGLVGGAHMGPSHLVYYQTLEHHPSPQPEIN